MWTPLHMFVNGPHVCLITWVQIRVFSSLEPTNWTLIGLPTLASLALLGFTLIFILAMTAIFWNLLG